MFVTTHVLVGAAVGGLTRRPLLALPLGVASHLALDAVPHWGGVSSATFLAVAVVDGLLGLTAMGAATVLSPPALRLAVLAGAAGAALPDLDKPADLFFGAHPFPPVFQAVHGAVQRESVAWWWVEALAVALSAAAVVTLLRRARRQARPRAAEPRRGTGRRPPR